MYRHINFIQMRILSQYGGRQPGHYLADQFRLALLRTFGLHIAHDEDVFFVLSGRYAFLIANLIAYLRRRRREAYRILRRVLPAEIASRIVRRE